MRYNLSLHCVRHYLDEDYNFDSKCTKTIRLPKYNPSCFDESQRRQETFCHGWEGNGNVQITIQLLKLK